jgi:hypothetical protein
MTKVQPSAQRLRRPSSGHSRTRRRTSQPAHLPGHTQPRGARWHPPAGAEYSSGRPCGSRQCLCANAHRAMSGSTTRRGNSRRAAASSTASGHLAGGIEARRAAASACCLMRRRSGYGTQTSVTDWLLRGEAIRWQALQDLCAAPAGDAAVARTWSSTTMGRAAAEWREGIGALGTSGHRHERKHPSATHLRVTVTDCDHQSVAPGSHGGPE